MQIADGALQHRVICGGSVHVVQLRLCLLDQQVASLEDIDMAVKKGLGHPMGPFELLDMTGIDLEYNVLMEKFRTTMDPADRPAAALVERYAQGAYGRKTGRGFYTYGEQGETKNG